MVSNKFTTSRSNAGTPPVCISRPPPYTPPPPPPPITGTWFIDNPDDLLNQSHPAYVTILGSANEYPPGEPILTLYDCGPCRVEGSTPTFNGTAAGVWIFYGGSAPINTLTVEWIYPHGQIVTRQTSFPSTR